MSQFVGLRYGSRDAVTGAAGAAGRVPIPANPIRGLAKLPFRFFTKLAKTLTVQVRR